MPKEIELYLTVGQALEEKNFISYIADNLRIKKGRINGFDILKKAVDARKKPVKYLFKFRVFIDEPFVNENYTVSFRECSDKKTVHIIGSGPAGLFAALEFLKAGIKPIIYERGKSVSERKVDIAQLNREHKLNIDSNYCFGEGGAGTFSDGKLYTRSKKKGDIFSVLKTFVDHGAPNEILYDATPHIGTDVLPRVITSIRETIIDYGGEFYFNSKLTDIEVVKGKVKSIIINNNNSIPVSKLVLATGHSARDIYRLLNKKGVLLEPKPFAAGIRIEHPQELINSIQYHGSDYNRRLPPAQYKLVEQIDGRGVFSFCMCPGGIIVPSATDQNQLVVNGMSNSKRNSPFANAGIVVQVNPEDTTDIEEYGPLQLLAFQEALEKGCVVNEKNTQTAPAQRMVDFVKGKFSDSLPQTSYIPGIQSVMMQELLPSFIGNALKKAFVKFDNKMKGFYTNQAIILGTESRTSSPVRIPRKENFEHVTISGLFPCGEGAGYAGGITSSAIDGINCAKAISGIE